MSPLAQGYRRIFGGTQSPVQLYGGFVAFFAGGAMALIGILVAVSGELFIEEPWQRYKTGILFAALGAPLVFMGIQLTLPSRFVVHVLSGIGVLICLIGVYMFYQAWPYEWGVRQEVDRSATTIGVYTLGLVLLVTTTGLALVVNFVSRWLALPGQEPTHDLFADPQRSATMEEVLRDIEREVNRQKLTWGGIEEDRLPREYVKLKADFGPGARIYHGRAGTITKTAAKEMEFAFESLARLRGVEGREVAGEDDTQVAIDALRALRAARQKEQEASWWYRFKRACVALFTGKRAQRPDHGEPRTPRQDPQVPQVIPDAQEKSHNDKSTDHPTDIQSDKQSGPTGEYRNYPKVERGKSSSAHAGGPARRPIALTPSTGTTGHRTVQANGHHKGPVRVPVHKVLRKTGPRRPYRQ